jgi:hypothetical protein
MAKLTVICQVYNESAKGNLRRFLYEIARYADALIVYNDGSTDNTKSALEVFQKHVEHLRQRGEAILSQVEVINAETNDFGHEIFHKQTLLNKAIEIGSTHILWLDADECVQADKVQELRQLCDLPHNGIDAWVFPQVNLWRTDRYYRLDNQYGDGMFTRLWRNNGNLHYAPEAGLHHRQHPQGIINVKDVPIKIIHWGFASDASILDKYNTYKSHGQNGWALHRLVDENGLTLKGTDIKWLPSDFEGRTLNNIKSRLVDLL